MTLQARPTTTPSKWLLRFVKVDDTTQVQVCIASAIANTGDPVQLTFTEVSSGAAPLSGTITLVPGQWNLQVCEQASTTNLDYLQSDRIDVFTALVEVKGPDAVAPAPTSCCDVIEANTWVETKACMAADAIQDATDDLCALPTILDCTQLVNAAIVAGASPYNGVYFPIWDENDAHWHYYLDGDINSYSLILRGSWTLDVITADTTGGEYPWDVAWSGLSGGTVTQATVADLGCGGGGGGDVDIEINGTPYDTITAPATEDIPVLNTAATPVGTVDPGVKVEIGDTTLTFNGGAFLDVVAEGTQAITVQADDFSTNVGADFGGGLIIVTSASVNTTDGLTLVDTILPEGSLNLPQVIIQYTNAAGSNTATAASNTLFNGTNLATTTIVPRRELTSDTGGGTGVFIDLDDLIAGTVPAFSDPLKFGWGAGDADTLTWTVTSDEAGTYGTYTQDGASGTITYSKNGAAFAALSGSITLAAADTIIVRRTVTTSAGFSKWAA